MTMKSELNYKEFKRRLTELTSKEKDFYLFTPYNSSGKPFCGTFDDSTFDLTRNSFWRHVKAIQIKGKYREVDNGYTEIDYTIGQSKFMRTFSIIFFCVVFLAINTFLFLFRDKVEYSAFFALNGFLGFGLIWAYGLTWVTKRIVNQRFKDEFEIGVEDEWEKLANSIAKN
jgi:hypothetical protein